MAKKDHVSENPVAGGAATAEDITEEDQQRLKSRRIKHPEIEEFKTLYQSNVLTGKLLGKKWRVQDEKIAKKLSSAFNNYFKRSEEINNELSSTIEGNIVYVQKRSRA